MVNKQKCSSVKTGTADAHIPRPMYKQFIAGVAPVVVFLPARHKGLSFPIRSEIDIPRPMYKQFMVGVVPVVFFFFFFFLPARHKGLSFPIRSAIDSIHLVVCDFTNNVLRDRKF